VLRENKTATQTTQHLYQHKYVWRCDNCGKEHSLAYLAEHCCGEKGHTVTKLYLIPNGNGKVERWKLTKQGLIKVDS
jgi:hypothetical protein